METIEFSSFFSDNDMPAFAKVGIYGGPGTGKTRTAYEIAIGLIKEYNLKKPVAFFDTETGSNWILPLFKKENILCGVKKSRTFIDLMNAIDFSEKYASILIIDSISHVWRELIQSFLDQHNEDRKKLLINKYGKDWTDKNFKKSNQLEFQHWNIIKPMWGKFTERYLNSQLHCIVCGRAGDIYEYQENESGKKELIKSGTRMATEKELSYEPSLLIELQRRYIEGKDHLFAVIEKDRGDKINGKEFELVKYSDLKPHFDFININGNNKETDFNKNSSKTLFSGNTMEPEDEFSVEKRKRTEISEEIEGIIKLYLPGQDIESKKKKLEILQKICGSTSWTKIQNSSSDLLMQWLEKIKNEFLNI